MASLKDKIFNALKHSEDIDDVLNDLSKYRDLLLKNNSNSVFSDNDRNKILEEYNNLEVLGKSLYRYNALKENNLIAEAEKEKTKILKGRISYNKYIWHSENDEHTCDECSSLDGQIFDSIEDVPERPHPNCKCTIEIFDNNIIIPTEEDDEDEPCDCWDKIEDIIDESVSLQDDLEIGLEEIEDIYENDYNIFCYIRDFKQQIELSKAELDEVESCGENCIAYLTGMAVNITDDKNLEDIMENLSTLTNESRQVYQIFLEHKHEMEETRDGMDKYYHAKANCTAAELGLIQELWAVVFSVGKEVKDFIYKVFEYHMNFIDVAQDCLQDLKADFYGILKAKEHGYCSEKVKNIYKDIFNKK